MSVEALGHHTVLWLVSSNDWRRAIELLVPVEGDDLENISRYLVWTGAHRGLNTHLFVPALISVMSPV